jgi:hypothetical protein
LVIDFLESNNNKCNHPLLKIQNLITYLHDPVIIQVSHQS